MAETALSLLKSRGFFRQCTNEAGLEARLSEGPVCFYCGFDPTGPSLHCGHLVPLFAMAHLQQAGHRPIALVGGGTARIGDPSGKIEMRKMLSVSQIRENAQKIKAQISRFIPLDNGKGRLLDNADWLTDLNYIDFLRTIGSCFSVNKMLSFEAYKKRMETGLSFIEFNYQLLQSYDFLTLSRTADCCLQIGGDDQWGNMVAGIDLIRRLDNREAFALTFPLVTRSDGKKMGKTEKGAVFLDSALTSVYDFFQYWRNVADADVGKFLKLYTFLPVEECDRLGAAADGSVNRSKEILAYELTRIIHGKEAADAALAAAKAVFGSLSGAASASAAETPSAGSSVAGVPSLTVSRSRLADGISAVELFALTSLCSSRAEARRLIEQGGARINDLPVTDVAAVVNLSALKGVGSNAEPAAEEVTDAAGHSSAVVGELFLRAGKKRFFRIEVVSDSIR